MKKKILVIFLIMIIMFIPSYKVEAKTLQDLKNELADLKSKKAATENNKNLTDSQIKSLRVDIDNTQIEIENTKKEIIAATEKISSSEKEIEEKDKETNELLKFLQVSNGENIYLEYLFEADSYTDFIYRYSVVSQLTEYNSNLMESLKKLVKELEDSKVTLASKQKELEVQSNNLASKLATLKANLSKLEEEGTTIDEDIDAKEKDIKYYESKGCKLNQNINSCVTIPNSSGWKLPLTSAWVTSEYQVVRTDCIGCGGTSHRGIDLGASEGTYAYAAAKGRVAYIVRRGSCGGNMVYIYHTINGVPYTTVYMHLLEIKVNVDDIVDTNTVVGLTGGLTTGAMNPSHCSVSYAGKGGYDYCTCGGHLHFGVATGNDVSRFNANSFNPRNLVPFASGSYLKRY